MVVFARRDRMSLPPIYDLEAVAPMWQELAAVGVEPLKTPSRSTRRCPPTRARCS
jgi:hypothetical protein